ncbi:hypothetical protein RFI_17860 [Reticulomyxa filosa]|uniref:Uncharacterized protein n=1 Tax=Reticulomyxa filosa TaxID=46433 RepID=X6MZD2_RETFI|nr:hypothetical protein RFI_17860 [Reticulomyxa filosa]|eukprot:ETO19370.1 hypothetical protein RFI_17860 [Reticulomyxa filosa]
MTIVVVVAIILVVLCAVCCPLYVSCCNRLSNNKSTQHKDNIAHIMEAITFSSAKHPTLNPINSNDTNNNNNNNNNNNK